MTIEDTKMIAEDQIENGVGKVSEVPLQEEAADSTPPHIARKASISEAASLASGGNAPWWLSWFEIPFHVKDPVDGKRLPEATGWAMDSAARGPLNQYGSYVGNAILRMAIRDAKCKNPRMCDVAVKGGLKPSSLLTATSSIIGVIGAILMPFVGAIVDHTKYRKHMGVLSGIFVVGMTGIQIGISEERNNWFFILVIDALQSFGLLVHSTAVFAYLPDLTTDEEVIPHYTAQFYVRQFSMQFVFASLLIIIAEVRDFDRSLAASVETAKYAALIAFICGVIFIGYAWTFLFRKRPALSQVPEGQSLLTTGFIQVKNTSRKIYKDYNALKWFMISLLWSPEAGNGVVLSIAVSFLTVDIGFAGQDIARLSLILMITTIVGSLFSKFITPYLNPLNSYRTGLTFIAISLGMTAGVLRGPEDRHVAFGLSAFWGFSLGWTYPSQRVLFCTLIPKGQETEMMGLFAFTGQILGWLPPLIVTICNENGVELRFGLVVVSAFCLTAVFFTFLMGSYKDAADRVALDSEAKLESVLHATKALGNCPPTNRNQHINATQNPHTNETQSVSAELSTSPNPNTNETHESASERSV